MLLPKEGASNQEQKVTLQTAIVAIAPISEKGRGCEGNIYEFTQAHIRVYVNRYICMCMHIYTHARTQTYQHLLNFSHLISSVT